MNPNYLETLVDIAERHAPGWHINNTSVPALRCSKYLKADSPLARAMNLSPCLCLIVQGRKTVTFGNGSIEYRAGEYLISPHHLPITWVVNEGSHEKPYLCLLVEIDLSLVGDLLANGRLTAGTQGPTPPTLFKGQVHDTLADALVRLASLLDNPDDVPYLAPIYLKEVYYRLVTSEYGGNIVRAATPGSNAQKISQVVYYINNNFLAKLDIDELANMVNMSTSSFYQHFKAMTTSSPLQYQKQLRLIEARRLMVVDSADATRAAYLVGYESPSQFNREYSRMFGNSPSRDRDNLRNTARNNIFTTASSPAA